VNGFGVCGCRYAEDALILDPLADLEGGLLLVSLVLFGRLELERELGVWLWELELDGEG